MLCSFIPLTRSWKSTVSEINTTTWIGHWNAPNTDPLPAHLLYLLAEFHAGSHRSHFLSSGLMNSWGSASCELISAQLQPSCLMLPVWLVSVCPWPVHPRSICTAAYVVSALYEHMRHCRSWSVNMCIVWGNMYQVRHKLQQTIWRKKGSSRSLFKIVFFKYDSCHYLVCTFISYLLWGMPNMFPGTRSS